MVIKSWRLAVVLLGASLGLASASGAQALAGPSSARPSPLLRTFGPAGSSLLSAPTRDLDGVFCTSAANCWSVGSLTSSNGAELDQVLHWTGKKWFKATTPNPGGTGKFSASELFAVRCTSASNCWAVGDYIKNEAHLDQVLHWTGKKWFLVPAPTPGGTVMDDVNTLNDVACTSARSCWAAGSYGSMIETSNSESELMLNQALHWDGKKWSLISTPQPGGTAINHANSLESVRCTAPKDCWAAGTFGRLRGLNKTTLTSEMLHWNGSKWATVTVPSPGGTSKGSVTELISLSCTSAANCWATGVAGRFGPTKLRILDLALHWNGRKWLRVATPGASKSDSLDSLIFVTCVSASDCWAVGGVVSMSNLNQILHWNGAKWSRVKAPNPAGTGTSGRQSLNSVRCVSKADCWAVGVQQTATSAQQNEILHWNGTKWSAS